MRRKEIKVPPQSLGAGHPDLGPVEHLALDLLKPFPGNARRHDDRQLAKIQASIQSFGFVNPILAERDGTIIAGHGRWMAAKALGLRQCPVIRIDHLTPDAARAYRLADNRLAELSGWDKTMLEIELQHLSAIELDFNIEAIGWEHAEIDLMLDPQDTDEATGDVVDEDVQPPPAQPVTQLGDLWLLGDHRLLCGNALEAADFAVLMNGRKAQMVFVDAPYNVPVNGHVSGLGKTRHREFAMATGEMTDAEFRTFLAANARLLSDNVEDGAILAMCMDWRGLLPLQLALADASLSLKNMAVWVKSNGGMGSLYRSQHEIVLIAKKGTARHINNVELGKHGRYRTNVWRYAGVNSFGKGRMEQLSGHPTPKPVAMVADAIRDVTHRGHIVLDSFMGSGTTLLAAERTGRIACGMDLDAGYVDLAIGRWEKMTGAKARHAASGKTFAQMRGLRQAGAGADSAGDLERTG